MTEIKDLCDAGNVAEEALFNLNQAMSAFIVTLDGMDNEIQTKWERNPALALNFVARFPMYSDTLHLILGSMRKTLDSLQAGTDAIFEAHKKQTGTKGSATSIGSGRPHDS